MRFVNAYLDPCILSYGCVSSPRWSTRITAVDSGAEFASIRWANPLWRFTIPEAARGIETVNSLRNHWLAMRGPAYVWPFRDPNDYASVNVVKTDVVPTVSGMDVQIGVGDGVETEFQLTKRYQSGPQTYDRKIILPVVSTLLVTLNGVITTAYNVSRPGGLIEFDFPPGVGVVVRAGYLFDCLVRFENDDSFDLILRAVQVQGFANMELVEVRNCENGVSD